MSGAEPDSGVAKAPLQLKEFPVSITEAKADFDRLLRRVRRGRVACITRYGKPWVYLISVRDYRELTLRVATALVAEVAPKRRSRPKAP